MRFDYLDKDDTRVVLCSPFARDYHAAVIRSPNSVGIYMFIDDDDEVIYIGKTSAGGLKDEIEARRGTNAERDAVRYRWFLTNDGEIATELEAYWIKKYGPRNNILGM